MMFTQNTTPKALLLSLSLLGTEAVLAQEPKAGQVAGRVFTAAYLGLPPVAVDQVQVVYYLSLIHI